MKKCGGRGNIKTQNTLNVYKKEKEKKSKKKKKKKKKMTAGIRTHDLQV